jgi:hypothetical protein
MSDAKQIPSLKDHLSEYVERIEAEIERLEGMRDEAADALDAISPSEKSSPPSPAQAQSGKPSSQ